MVFVFSGDSLLAFMENEKEIEKETKKEDHDEVLLSESEAVIREIIICDHKENLFSFVKGLSHEEKGNEILVDKLLRLICSHQALGCAMALVAGETGLKVDLNRRNCWGSFPLHEAARSLFFHLIELFICYGALTESEDYGELLPLRVAIERVSSDENFIQWTPDQSIFKLIIKLCLPKVRRALRTISFLARKTEGVEEMIRNFVEECKLIELAILLMVGKAKVVQRIMFEREDDTLNRNMTPRQCINSNIASLIDQEFKLMGKAKKEVVAQICKERKAAMMSALLLLEIFERAGDTIEAYLNLGRTAHASEEYVTQEVASLIARAGFILNSEDTGLTNMVDRYPSELLKELSGDVEYEFLEEEDDDEPEPHLHLWDNLEKDPSGRLSKVQWKVIKRTFHGPLSIFDHIRPIKSFSSSTASFCSGISRTICVQAERGTKGFEPYVRNSPLSKRLVPFALAIKRGIRRI